MARKFENTQTGSLSRHVSTGICLKLRLDTRLLSLAELSQREWYPSGSLLPVLALQLCQLRLVGLLCLRQFLEVAFLEAGEGRPVLLLPRLCLGHEIGAHLLAALIGISLDDMPHLLW